MIHHVDFIQCGIGNSRIEHCASDELHASRDNIRGAKIENAHPVAIRDECRHKVLPDKAAASCNERPCHGRGKASRGRNCMAGAKSSLKPRATNNFAIMNIGPIGCRLSNGQLAVFETCIRLSPKPNRQ
jgi:hypothetical protein